MISIIICFILTAVISYNYGKMQGMREIMNLMDRMMREIEEMLEVE